MTDHTAVLRDLAKFRESFVMAVGDKSPFAKEALKLADDAIAALAQPQQPAGWMPIETAPKDGTRFIGLGPIPSDGGIEARETRWRFYGEGSLAKAAFDRGEGPSGNWCWREPIHNWASSWSPTHWMPLPPPPGAHPSQQEDDARDAVRLDWMVAEECVVQGYHGGDRYRVYWPVLREWQSEFFPTPRAAIDAAMSDSAGEGGKNGSH